jgi:flagellar basal-body rod protein FlgB
MDLNQIPLFAALKGKLSHTVERQKLIAANVANADVPNYAPKDLKPFAFSQALQMAGSSSSIMPPMAMTSPGHMEIPALAAIPTTGTNESVASPDSEIRLDGNHVVLEEQMVKMSEARMDYDAAIGFYQQSMGLLKMAISKPGG